MVMVYAVMVVTVIFAVATLAIDFGRVNSVKMSLQCATDAAARYAASAMRSSMNGTSGAAGNATAAFAQSPIDGAVYPFNAATEMTLGIWTPATRTFLPASVAAGANAVKIQTSLVLGTATHGLMVLPMFNRQVTVHATSVAMINGADVTTPVSATGNPWLAGMPNGSVTTSFRSNPAEYDSAGSAPNVNGSPALVPLAALGTGAGKVITFDGVTGAATWGGGTAMSDADGDATRVVNLGSPAFNDYSNFTSPMNGMSNCHAPIDAVVAVFLGPAAPDASAAPSPLDFNTAASRDYTSISPLLKQVFFVGDGRRANGEVQQIVVPAGATRLFIASMDGWQYNGNTGGYNLTVHATQTISSVQMR